MFHLLESPDTQLSLSHAFLALQVQMDTCTCSNSSTFSEIFQALRAINIPYSTDKYTKLRAMCRCGLAVLDGALKVPNYARDRRSIRETSLGHQPRL